METEIIIHKFLPGLNLIKFSTIYQSRCQLIVNSVLLQILKIINSPYTIGYILKNMTLTLITTINHTFKTYTKKQNNH
jgi:hypothetical protein